jgi:hypothetical protein
MLHEAYGYFIFMWKDFGYVAAAGCLSPRGPFRNSRTADYARPVRFHRDGFQQLLFLQPETAGISETAPAPPIKARARASARESSLCKDTRLTT